MKKIISLILCICMVFCAIPVFSISAETSTGLTYTFANDFIANADGVICYGGEIDPEVTSVNLYWADADSKPLDGYLPFATTDSETLASGYQITGNLLIPKGAKTVAAEFVTVGLNSMDYVDIPAEKQNSGDDIYTMFFVSDSHINADEENNPYMDKASMVTRFNVLKSLMNDLSAQGDNVIGTSLIGDVVVGVQVPNGGGHGVWEAYEEDYTVMNEVLSETGFEAAYPIWYINGNHDIIYCENGDNSAWINFLDQKIADYNTAIENNVYSENIMSAISEIDKENGKYWYDTYVNGYHYIYLSVPYNGFGIYSDEQLNWLDGLLAEDAKQSKTTFVIGHYPLSYTHENSAGHFDNSAELEAVLEKYPNTIYISGHTHISPEANTDNVLIGNQETTKINTGALISTITDADGNKIYTPNGIYCKVFADRIEFHARVFCNLNNGTDGYWVSNTSKVLNLKNTVNSSLSAEISADKKDIRNGTTLTAKVNGVIADTEKYECKWYVNNTLVGTGATHTLSYYYDKENSLITPSGNVSVCITDLSDNTNLAWSFLETKAEIFKEISTGDQLAKIGLDSDYPLDGKYILTNDIDLSSFENWTPIGNSYTTDGKSSFSGVLDGNGYTISNLSINATEITSGLGQVYAGLFNHIIGAEIRNLVMKNATVSAGNSSYQAFAGVIAANAEASASGTPNTIKNIAIIDSTVTITAAYNSVFGAGAFIGSVNKRYTDRRAGGVKFEDCYSNANISANNFGDQSCAGGFAGYIYRTKTPCKINNSIFDGKITGNLNGKTLIGGFSAWSVSENTLVTNGYSNGDKYTETTEYLEIRPPVCGTKLTTEQLISSTVTSLNLSDKWINSNIGPVLKIAEYDLLYADYIKISTGTELAKIGVDVNYPLDGKYILTNDIDLSSFKSWTPIGDINNTDDRTAETPLVFWGTLDGNGHTIKNLTIDWTTGTSTSQIFVGLFSATRGATIKNIIFDNANVTVSNTLNQNFAGIVAGSAEATNDGKSSQYTNIHIKNSAVAIAKTKYDASGVGSFVGTTNKRVSGSMDGGLILSNCYSNASVTNKGTHSNTGNGQTTCGGFIGYAYATKSTGLQISNSVF